MRKIILFLILLCFFISGCSGEKNTAKNLINAYTVLDDSGASVTLQGKPQRIVSLTYGTDEIIAELVDLKTITAFSHWADDAQLSFLNKEQLRAVKKRSSENAEAVLQLNPDLVLVSTATVPGVVKSLRDMGLPVYVARSPKTYDEMKEKIMGMAKLVQEEGKGQEIVGKMDRDLAETEKHLTGITAPKQKVVMLFYFGGVSGRRGNLVDEMLKMAHIRNGAAELGMGIGSNTISKEQVVEKNPDVFFIPAWNFGHEDNDVEKYRQEILTDPAFKNVKAIKNNKVIAIGENYRNVASQHIVESIRVFAMAVYPECF
jgi:iron complex transport system substrate-binding protein